jgi:dipeptidyl aminopeptidase/acylaminoacyl peptidase
MQFQGVSAVTPSPDGRLAVWVQTRPVIETERSEQVSQLWVGPSDGSRRFELTRSEKGASNPQWSPDGKYVFFVSDRGGGPQIYRILIAGGEAEKLTDFKGGMNGSYGLSPNGKAIAFTAYEAPADEEKSKKEKRDLHVVDANPANHALYFVAIEPDAEGKHKHKKVFEAKYHVADFDWSPDSRFIAFSHTPTPGADDWTRSDVSEVEVETGKLKDLAAGPAAESAPIYSPDGRYVAFRRSSNPPRWAAADRIVLLNRQSGDARELPATYDQQPNLIGWTADSANILFTEAKRTRTSISAMPVDGPPVAIFEPSQGVINSVKLSRDGAYLGMAWETTDQAPEGFVLKEGSHTPVQVSRANSDLPKLPLGHTEVFKWKSKDGLEVEGLLTYPVDYEKGKRVPLILNIHGGPTGVFGESFIGRASLYPIAVFAAKGYAVLRPNPRGSGGYGQPFRFANYNDWGGKDYEDDQTGVDAVIAMGVADPDRLAIMGWSYGGYMTSWTITQTKRFKAAVIGAGVTDLWSFTGTADIPGFLPDYFGGEAWDNFDGWRKHSPITYIKGVTTPTLLLHGEADERVPITQGYEYYNALKRQGTLTKMVVYPRTPHGPREPKFILDIMQRHVDWVEKYVR